MQYYVFCAHVHAYETLIVPGSLIPQRAFRCTECTAPIRKYFMFESGFRNYNTRYWLNIIKNNEDLKQVKRGEKEYAKCEKYLESVYTAVLNGRKIAICSNKSCQNHNNIFEVYNVQCEATNQDQIEDQDEKHDYMCDICEKERCEELAAKKEHAYFDNLMIWNKYEYGCLKGTNLENRIIFRKCPHCYRINNRDGGGCFHITCYNCGKHFCWHCNILFNNSQQVYIHLRNAFGTVFPVLDAACFEF